MSLQKVKLHIAGAEYVITTDEPEEYVHRLGEEVDRAMAEAMSGNARISANMAAVLVALTKADQAHKAVDSADRLREQMKGYLDDNARAHQEADAARREADALRRELQDLRRKMAAPYQG